MRVRSVVSHTANRVFFSRNFAFSALRWPNMEVFCLVGMFITECMVWRKRNWSCRFLQLNTYNLMNSLCRCFASEVDCSWRCKVCSNSEKFLYNFSPMWSWFDVEHEYSEFWNFFTHQFTISTKMNWKWKNRKILTPYGVSTRTFFSKVINF